MTEEPVVAEPGTIVWADLTVPDAAGLRAFYEQVVGWDTAPHDMGDYYDFDVKDGSGRTVAGLCHARGENANIPPVWVVYVQVENVNAAANRCVELGGRIVDGPREMGGVDFCLLEDPAGAVLAVVS